MRIKGVWQISRMHLKGYEAEAFGLATASGTASGTLVAYSPAKKLAQGYAYVEVEKKGALHSVSDINAGDDINIYLIDGHARAVVSEVINDETKKMKKH